jgi:hypothetical protein
MPLLRKESCPILLGLRRRLLAEVEPSSLFEKSDHRFDDLQIWHPLFPWPINKLSLTVFLGPLSP